MKPRNVTIEAPKKGRNGKYTCNVVAIYPSGAVYSQHTAEYEFRDHAQVAAQGVQVYLSQRDDKEDGQS